MTAPTSQSRGTARATPPRPACTALGDAALLRQRLLGVLCSIPGSGGLIIQTLDAIRAPQDAGAPTIGGFPSPLERECLDRPPRGEQPVIRGRY